jgi:hypothetical protein
MCSSQNARCRPQPTAIALTDIAEAFSDRAATDYGIDGHTAVGSALGLDV